MLKEFLRENNLINVNVKAKDWKEAVKCGTKLLVDAKIVEDKYYDSIIESTEKYGPYYVICPGVAMPHSRPEDGVIKNGVSIITLEEPINFGNASNDPVKILITFAATDDDTQIDLIQDIVEVLSLEENVSKIQSAKTVEDIFEVL